MASLLMFTTVFLLTSTPSVVFSLICYCNTPALLDEAAAQYYRGILTQANVADPASVVQKMRCSQEGYCEVKEIPWTPHLPIQASCQIFDSPTQHVKQQGCQYAQHYPAMANENCPDSNQPGVNVKFCTTDKCNNNGLCSNATTATSTTSTTRSPTPTHKTVRH